MGLIPTSISPKNKKNMMTTLFLPFQSNIHIKIHIDFITLKMRLINLVKLIPTHHNPPRQAHQHGRPADRVIIIIFLYFYSYFKSFKKINIFLVGFRGPTSEPAIFTLYWAG